MVRSLMWSALAFGAGITLVIALAGQGLALATFVGWLRATDAHAATSWCAVMVMLWFVVFVLDKARHEGWHRQGTQRSIHLGAAVRVHPLRTLAGLYWILSFVGLIVLGGLDNKGLIAQNGHYYLVRANDILTPISHTEYQRQAAYPLWMFSAATLFVAALILGLAVPRSPRVFMRLQCMADHYV